MAFVAHPNGFDKISKTIFGDAFLKKANGKKETRRKQSFLFRRVFVVSCSYYFRKNEQLELF